MNKSINELKNKYDITIILDEQYSIYLELLHNDEIINFNIKYEESYPYTLPKIEVLNKNKYLSKGYVPNDFELESLDTKWKYNLICVFDEIISKI